MFIANLIIVLLIIFIIGDPYRTTLVISLVLFMNKLNENKPQKIKYNPAVIHPAAL